MKSVVPAVGTPNLERLSVAAAALIRPASYLLVKLATRCNLGCTYCYWFRDATIYDRPAVMKPDVEAALLDKLEQHLRIHRLRSFFLLFHGGEPLLFGKRRFAALAGSLRALEARLGVTLRLAVTTNATLIDAEWVALFRQHRIGVTVSLDGPPALNDLRRPDLRGGGTYDATIRGLTLLRDGGIEPGVLAVCDPESDPAVMLAHFVDTIGVTEFDVLVPDATHEDQPTSIAPYYTRLFDLWLDLYATRGVRVRYLDNLVAGLTGHESRSESIGYGPNLHFTMLTDGALEALDTTRIIGDGGTASRLNILTHAIQDTVGDPLWQELLEASVTLHADCQACPYWFACGGGHIASRWSEARGFDNPSVYCADHKAIFRHIWARLTPDLVVVPPDEAVSAGPV